MHQEDGMHYVVDPEVRFYHDVSVEDQKKWTAELRKCPGTQPRTPVTQAAYLWHPVTYLLCEDDKALPLQIQQLMVDNARKAGAKIETESCSASHSPFLSMPEKVLEVMERTLVRRG
jgi:hypothetical protein